MTRSELIGDLVGEICKAIPDREADLDGDDIDTVQGVVQSVLNDATDAIDEVNDEEETVGT